VFSFCLCKCLDLVRRRSLQDGLHFPDLEGSSTAHVSVFADLSRHNSDCRHCYPGLISKASRRLTSSSSSSSARGQSASEREGKTTRDTGANMTGKRPRTLRRTSSESLIESESSLTHECSPLSEHHPKEKLKPTLLPKEPVQAAAPRRLVIGFNPKPLLLTPENNNNGGSGNGSVNCNVAACSSKPSSSPAAGGERSPVHRSGLESLLSTPRERKVSSDGVGLAIVAAMMHSSVPRQEEHKAANIVDRRNQREHRHHDVAIATIKIAEPPILSSSPHRPHKPSCYTAAAPAALPYQPQIQTQSIPIHAPGSFSSSSQHKSSSSGRPSQQRHRSSGATQPSTGAYGQGGASAMLAWLRQADREQGERDTFLLRASPIKSQVAVRDAAAAACPTVHFLDACYFCKRHLADGKDIYMYR
jgi:hypothetical protein